jgi:hypothetical protein
MLYVRLRGLCRVMKCMLVVPVRRVGMMGSLLVLSGLVMLSCLVMMTSCVLMVLGCLFVMLCSLLRHFAPPLATS